VTLSSLIKSCAVSLIWSGLAICWALFARWDILALSKAFYVLLTYSVIFLAMQAISTLLTVGPFVRPNSRYKLAEHIITIILVISLFFYVTFHIIKFSEILYLELAKRNSAWTQELSGSDSISWFISISFEHWWFITVLVARNIWRFFKHRKYLAKHPDKLEIYEEKLFMRYELAMYGLVGIPLMLMALVNAGDQIGLYYFLIVIFFLPWADFADIAKRIYDDYWKID